jgi:GLPGLI family protein
MKQIIILTLIFFLNISHSQNNVVTYNFKILEDKKILDNPVIGEMYAEQVNAAKFLEFELTFNDTISKFESLKTLELDQKNIMNALIASRNKKTKFIYNDTIYYNNGEGAFNEDKYLIISALKKDWVFTNETKKINNYTCYKATTEYITINSRGKFKHPVIAWYCPEIPYQFGPAGYGALPGLILELQERNIVFGAIKIQFKVSEEKIVLPTKGKKISNEDYQNQIAEAVKKHFEDN